MPIRLLATLFFFFTLSAWAGSPRRSASLDSLVIDKDDFQVAVLPESTTSSRTARVHIKLHTKFSLKSQEKAVLRAAVSGESEDAFSSVYAKDVNRREKLQKQELSFTIDRPKLKVIRVLVWLDKEGATSPPAPLASDNIAFESAAFLNGNDR